MEVKEELIPELIRQGKDREVVPVLYKKVFPMVTKYITGHYGRKEDAADIFQDALMMFYSQVIKKEFNEQYKVYGYLYRVCINRWINKIKREKKIELKEEMETFEISEEQSMVHILAENRDNILQTFFSNIGDKCIEVLTYTIYNDLLLEDVMIRMGFASVDAVKMQIHRCKQKLIKEIQNNPALINKLKGL